MNLSLLSRFYSAHEPVSSLYSLLNPPAPPQKTSSENMNTESDYHDGSLSYRDQFIDLQSKLNDWFLYDRELRHERVKSLVKT